MTAILDADEALCIELDEIERRRDKAGVEQPPPADVVGETATVRATRLGLTALCLSGGGIRSAAFCLGVVQALAAKKLLNTFDYVSTVSGGGFVGGWLQMMLHETGNVADAQEELGKGTAPPLRRLRGYTNYLTPQTGPFSADTWAGIMLYLRNLILNWLVFAPALLLAGLAPIFYRTTLAWLHDCPMAIIILFGIGIAGLIAAACQGCMALPSHRVEAAHGPANFAPHETIVWWIAAPALAWAFLVPYVLEYGLAWESVFQKSAAIGSHEQLYQIRQDARAAYVHWLHFRQLIIPVAYVTAMCAGYALAWWRSVGHDTGSRLYSANFLRWCAATLAAAVLLWVGLRLIYPGSGLRELAMSQVPGDGRPFLVDAETALATLFPLWLTGTHVLQTTFYVGLRREALFADLDREWLARLSGLVLRVGLAWTVFAACVLVLPGLLDIVKTGDNGAGDIWFNSNLAHLFGTTTVVGGVAAWLGKWAQARIEAVASQSGSRLIQLLTGAWLGWVLAVLCTIFAVGLLIASGSTLEHLLGKLQEYLVNSHDFDWLGPLLNIDLNVTRQSPWVPPVLQSVLAVPLVMAVWRFGRINVNRFSMHAVYRNRLARAFVGSARQYRHPEPFTGFDIADTAPNDGPRIVEDNPRLAKFRMVPEGQRLFPVINMTLNVTAGTNTAWTERKGECFIATPLVCGAAELRHPDQRERNTSGDPAGAFVRTKDYAGMETMRDAEGREAGPRIGSVMTISGAAISPNWGYHSSRATAFLMALFNVRLGAWLPNPSVATQDDLRLAKPKNSLIALMSEVAGITTDVSQAVYLSDGGHFENLGLYEMLRRRCRHIVVVDAGQDQDCTFFDLGNAIRKAEIDFAARVTMQPMRIHARSAIEASDTKAADALGIAVGEIRYPDGKTGRLIYIKPSYLPGIPAEVRAYGCTNKSFPHISTLEQWFTESEFESYRALGAWQTRQLTHRMYGDSLDKLFDAAELMCTPRAPARDATGTSAPA